MIYDLTNTNVVTAQQFLDSNASDDTLQWKMDAPKDKTKKAQAIAKYYIQKGTIGGVGSMYGGMILLRNIESKFVTHSFSFDDSRKELLKQPLSELIAKTEDYKNLKDLLQLKCSFYLFSEEKSYYPEDALDSVKSLYEMHVRVCDTIAKQLPQADLPKNPQFKNEGFYTQNYDNYLKSDVAKVQVTFNIGKVSERVDDSVEIVTSDPKTGQFVDVTSECKNIYDYMMLLRNKKMDIVVYYDSCCIKKAGREIYVLPKLAVHQIILHDHIRKQHSTIGLKINSDSQ